MNERWKFIETLNRDYFMDRETLIQYHISCPEDLYRLSEKLNDYEKALNSRSRVDVNEIESLVCENQQLKLWQDNVFKLIKAKIKVYQHKPVSAPVSNPVSRTYDAEHDRLARLSELESLLQEVLLL